MQGQGQRRSGGRPLGRTVDGEKVRALRRQRAMTQVQLASRARVSERTVASVERGNRISLNTIRAIAAALEVEVEELNLAEQRMIGPVAPPTLGDYAVGAGGV